MKLFGYYPADLPGLRATYPFGGLVFFTKELIGADLICTVEAKETPKKVLKRRLLYLYENGMHALSVGHYSDESDFRTHAGRTETIVRFLDETAQWMKPDEHIFCDL